MTSNIQYRSYPPHSIRNNLQYNSPDAIPHLYSIVSSFLSVFFYRFYERIILSAWYSRAFDWGKLYSCTGARHAFAHDKTTHNIRILYRNFFSCMYSISISVVALFMRIVTILTTYITVHLFHFIHYCISCTYHPNTFQFLRRTHNTLFTPRFAHTKKTNSKWFTSMWNKIYHLA